MNDQLGKSHVFEIKRENDPGIIGLQIAALQKPEDASLLRAFAALENTESVKTIIGNIAALIAQKILELEGQSSGLVMPVTALIRRNIKDTEWEPTETDTLARMRIKLEDQNTAAARLICGMTLGDRALHFRAGMTGNRHFRQPQGYAATMAVVGYEAALEAAERTRERHIRPQIEPLLQKFALVVAVIRALMKKNRAIH